MSSNASRCLFASATSSGVLRPNEIRATFRTWPAFAAPQSYVEGPLRDLIREVPLDELRHLVARRPDLRSRIVGCCASTVASWTRGGWILDLGRGNLVLAGEGEAARLVYLDVEMKDAAAIRGTVREAMYEDVIERMRALIEALGERATTAIDPRPPAAPQRIFSA